MKPGLELTLFSAMGLLACHAAPRYDVRVQVAPTAIRSDGLVRLGYELQIGSASERSRVERIDVLSDDGRLLAELAAATLAGLMVHPDQPRGKALDATEIAPGQAAMVHLWITIPNGTSPPHAVRHRVVVRRQDGSIESTTSEAIELHQEPLVLASPLRGGLWLAHEGPGNPQSHHWAPLVTDGRVRIPQRFALDLIGVDATGRAVREGGAASRNEDWVGYDAEIVAVADGTVRDVRDHEPDKTPLVALPPVARPSLNAVAGNYVLLDLAEGRYALYAHLRPQSVTVRVGERVSRGQVLGRVGSSGSSNAPHLHFQMSDAVAVEAAEGLPYVFETFEALGETSALRAVAGEPGLSTPREVVSRRLRELPLDGWVVGFR